MKKFSFRLRTVLRQREIIEDMRKREVGAARTAVENARAEKEELEGTRVSAMKAKEELGEKKTSKAFEYGLVENFITGTKQKIAQKEKEIDRLNEEVRRRMVVYLEAYKKKRIVDRLKDKAQLAHKKETLKDEEKKAGDLFTVRFTHEQLKKEEEA